MDNPISEGTIRSERMVNIKRDFLRWTEEVRLNGSELREITNIIDELEFLIVKMTDIIR